jgi:hypothetical protein
LVPAGQNSGACFFRRPPDWLAVLRDRELRAVRGGDRSGRLKPNTQLIIIVYKGAVPGDEPDNFERTTLVQPDFDFFTRSIAGDDETLIRTTLPGVGRLMMHVEFID